MLLRGHAVLCANGILGLAQLHRLGTGAGNDKKTEREVNSHAAKFSKAQTRRPGQNSIYYGSAWIRTMKTTLLTLFCLTATLLQAADYPAPAENDFSIRDFRFGSGQTLPELRIHYRTLGQPAKDPAGKVTNAVLIMHGTTGSGAQFIRPEFAGELFGKDQPLD